MHAVCFYDRAKFFCCMVSLGDKSKALRYDLIWFGMAHEDI